MEKDKVQESLQILANGLDNAAKGGAFGLQESSVLLQALQVVAGALAPVKPEVETSTVKKVKK